MVKISNSDNIFTNSLKLTSKYTKLINELAKEFSVPNPTAFFVRQYGGQAENRLYAFNRFGYFQTGMIFEIMNYLKINYPNITISLDYDVKEKIKDRLPLLDLAKNLKKIDNISKDIELRPYQIEAIKSTIIKGKGRCMFEGPTGSGKSFIIANLIYTLQQQHMEELRTLLFLPNAQLVSQFKKDLLDYGFDESKILTFTPKTIKKLDKSDIDNAKIVISNRQFLFNHIKKLGNFDALIVDEVHSVSPDSKTEKLINSLKIPIKIGCSGTIPRDKHKYWRLLECFGPIVFTETITNLQEEGYLSNIKFNLVKVKDLNVEYDKNILFHINSNIKYSEGYDGEIAFNDAYIAETEYLVENCMDLYKPVLEKIKLEYGNTLILFDRIEFGKALYNFLVETKYNNADIFYVDGSIPIEKREDIRELYEKQDNTILVAQVATTSTGINIKNLTNLIMTGSNKSHPRTIQSIGRLLRPHNKKAYANVYDIVFYNFKYSRKHYNDRKRLYKQYYAFTKPHETINITV